MATTHSFTTPDRDITGITPSRTTSFTTPTRDIDLLGNAQPYICMAWSSGAFIVWETDSIGIIFEGQ